MEYLYDVIGEMLLEGTEFENAYSFLISKGTCIHYLYQVLLAMRHSIG